MALTPVARCNIPLNSSSVLLWQIWAEIPAGSLVANMFAKDLDAGENGTVTFSLASGELRAVAEGLTDVRAEFPRCRPSLWSHRGRGGTAAL